MIDKLSYLFACSLCLALAGGLTSCDDDETMVDEWSADYVYLERPVLGTDKFSFSLTHSSLGITGDTEVEQPLVVSLRKPFPSDVTVKLAYEGDLPAEAVSFRGGGTLMIPAGELSVRDTLDIKSEWTFVTDDAAMTYSVTISIGEVCPASGELRISSKQKSLFFVFNKAKKTDIVPNQKPEGLRIEDRSTWQAWGSSEKGGSTWDDAGDVINGNAQDYYWFYTKFMELKIDMGSVQTITGIESYGAFGAGYAMQTCTLYTSDNGTDWNEITPEEGLEMNLAAAQYVSFIVPVTTRYIRMGMARTSGQVLCSEFYAYAK